MPEIKIYRDVQEHYGKAAQINDDAYGHTVAKHFGYSEEELKNIPQSSNLGLSCGNPHALANLKEGETVIDLGSGAGFDVFLAAKKVGESGRAYGVDMSKEMLERANKIKDERSARNVTFVESRITDIELPDAVADCVISNCVINLVPEPHKPKVFQETFRLLKSGGRVAISDILAKGPLPEHIQSDIALYVGCIAGASQVSQYEDYLREAGFKDILIVNAESDLNVYREAGNSDCCGTISTESNGSTTTSSKCQPQKQKSACGTKTNSVEDKQLDFNEFAGSYKIFAVKA